MKEYLAKRPKAEQAGFTLVEILAAMIIMAIVIPVIVEGIAIAGRAAVAAERKREAAQLADRVLTEAIVTGQWRDTNQEGSFEPDYPGFYWRLTTETWDEDVMRLVSVEVTFAVQGRESFVRLSTLVSGSEL